MKNLSTQFRALVLLCLCALPVCGQETPEAVAKDFMEAFRAADWPKAAGVMHPEALKQLRSMFGPLIALAEKKEKERQQIEELFGVKNKAEFDKLSDAEVFAKLFDLVAAVSPETKSALNSSSFDIIGNVAEAPDRMHVVYRMHLKLPIPNLAEPIAFSKLDVMTLRKFENTWRAELKGDLQGVIQGMMAALQEASKKPETAEPAPKPATPKKKPTRKK